MLNGDVDYSYGATVNSHHSRVLKQAKKICSHNKFYLTHLMTRFLPLSLPTLLVETLSLNQISL